LFGEVFAKFAKLQQNGFKKTAKEFKENLFGGEAFAKFANNYLLNCSKTVSRKQQKGFKKTCFVG